MSDGNTSEFLYVLLVFLSVNWDAHVHSEAFDRECDAQSKRLSTSSSGSNSSEHLKLWDHDDASSLTFVDSTSHGVPKLEAYLYYFGIRGRRQLGPKLIYRTSTDVFTPPSGPAQNLRMMQLLPVYEHAKLGENNLWATIRHETVGILDRLQIQLTSVDLVRFRWKEETEDGRGKTATSRTTIWIGVLPDSTTGDAAFDSSEDILQLLKKHDISDVDVAYHESTAQHLTDPVLYAPVDDLHPLKDVIDWVTTALSLPIAGLKTLHMQGTLGFYFKVGEDLYGVAARDVLFPAEQGNFPYIYQRSTFKNVVLMGNRAFDDLLTSIKAHIGTLNNTVSILEKRVASYTIGAQAGNQQAARNLATTQADVGKKETIEVLRKFFVTMKRDWAEVNNRVIGHVVWAPPITGLTSPYNYTQDVCVIKLDKKKFLNFKGNVIDLGPEIEPGKFMSLMYPRYDAQSSFDYPENRLYEPVSILSAASIKEPDNQDLEGDPVRFVIKRGHTTAHIHRILGSFDSVETAVHAYNNDSGPFSRGGDSGSLIVGPKREFIALLTGGTGPTDSADITFGTSMEWLWNDVIKPEFPGAVLYFDTPLD
ncbi:hypothetical protein K488DRAFT_89481 [Vararia minispora EC-137]|uniref:Uncharacterized protein n=1 Tax=Vararia minispora EC-137 TaxID=1314806 RepID=A0ACB8QBN3_9AGAM|nr:hypothetical protein K488DRAFT_89481 [Vararia minispora EC-137]